MQQQNFKNHSKYVPSYHFVSSTLLVAILIVSIINLLHLKHEGFHTALALLLVAIVLPIMWFNMRMFALRAQDRAIRAEENLRHYILTGKPLNSKLRMRHIIALRFASDEEFPALAEKAANENRSNKQIKAAIVNWRPDYYRV